MKIEPPRLTPLGWRILIVLLALAAACLYWAATAVAWPILQAIIASYDAWKGPIGLAASGLGLAAALSIVRALHPRFYGFTELVFAAAGLIAITFTHSQQHPASVAIGFVGSIYVGVRGFTNVWESISEAKRVRIRNVFLEAEDKPARQGNPG